MQTWASATTIAIEITALRSEAALGLNVYVLALAFFFPPNLRSRLVLFFLFDFGLALFFAGVVFALYGLTSGSRGY